MILRQLNPAGQEIGAPAARAAAVVLWINSEALMAAVLAEGPTPGQTAQTRPAGPGGAGRTPGFGVTLRGAPIS
jgi:hypothetical protein